MTIFLKRTVTGLVYLLLLFGSLFGGEVTFGLFFLLVTFASMREFYKLTAKNGIYPQTINGILAGMIIFVVTFLFFSGHVSVKILFLIPLLFPGILITELFRVRKHPVQNAGLTFLGIIYIAVPLSLMNTVAFSTAPGGIVYIPELLAGICILIIVNDTVAYLVGVPFGRHKLMERISPKKSWEGVFGGVAATMIAGVFISGFFPVLTGRDWMVMAGIVAVFGTLGDLAESMFKRNMDIKDSGSVLPGHGGILDRIDAFLFVVPVAVFYFYISGLNYSML